MAYLIPGDGLNKYNTSKQWDTTCSQMFKIMLWKEIS